MTMTSSLRQIDGERVTVQGPIIPEPLPLLPAMEPQQPFPVSALGPILADAAHAIASKVQVPVAVAAQSVLAAASLTAQAHADVMMPYGQTRPLSLYLATIAGSGDRKSTADNEALWPIRRFERQLKEDHDRHFEVWSIEQAVWTAERKKIDANKKLVPEDRRILLKELGPEPPPPLYPFLTAPDPTVEGLAKAWVSAPAALGVFTAEGGMFVGGHGMSLDNRLKTAATYSQLWDGHPIRRVRAADGVTILDGRRLSLHIMIQPDAASTFLSDPLLRDQGLLSRMLVAAPASIAGTRLYRQPAPQDDLAIKRYGARLLSILEAPWSLADGQRNELAPRVLDIDADTVDDWMAFHDHVERQTGTDRDLASIKDFAAKAAEHAARIAGVLTIVDDIEATTISPPSMANAVTLADWYVAEALRLSQSLRADPRLVVAQSLLDWLKQQAAQRGSESVTFREILQRGPSAVRTKAAAESALDILVQHDQVIETAARPRTVRPVGA